MRCIVCLILILPFFSMAQENGIKFERELSWEQIKQKAKAENKYIFVDCYTTWCAPCKAMEKNIYPLESVGAYYNARFICLKVQMDTSKKDNEEIKKMYGDAHKILNEYDVNAYPSFLFFSPNGKLMHRTAGGYNENLFIALADDALNPEKQYYRLLTDFQNGKKDTSVMKQLARTTKLIGDIKLAQQIATEYISNLKNRRQFTKDNIQFIREFSQSEKAQQIANKYILSLQERELYNIDDISLMRDFLKSSKDRSFTFFYSHARRIDEIMKDKYTEVYVKGIIAKEEIDPILTARIKSKGMDPDWNKIKAEITKKYNKMYADRVVAGAKVSWYGLKKNYPEWTKSIITSVELADDMNNWYYINNSVWSVFL